MIETIIKNICAMMINGGILWIFLNLLIDSAHNKFCYLEWSKNYHNLKKW